MEKILQQIIQQLNFAFNEDKESQISAVLDNNENKNIIGWSFVKLDENGQVKPIDNVIYGDLKQLLKSRYQKVGEESKAKTAKIEATNEGNAWMGISNALDNVKQYMRVKESEFPKESEGDEEIIKAIKEEDVFQLVDFINYTLNGVLFNTIPGLREAMTNNGSEENKEAENGNEQKVESTDSK